MNRRTRAKQVNMARWLREADEPPRDPDYGSNIQDPLVRYLVDTYGSLDAIGRAALAIAQIRRDCSGVTPAVIDGIIRAMGGPWPTRPPEESMPRSRTHVPSQWELDSLERIAEIRAVGSVVYYMRIGNRVKIGFSRALRTRIDAIGPEEVMATEPGGIELEARRHRQFEDLWSHREWFRLEPPLTDHIEALRRQAAEGANAAAT